jgi:hypothetical protein
MAAAAMTTWARGHRLDDDDEDGPYDPKYPGRKVVADGGRVRVPLYLSDCMPGWLRPPPDVPTLRSMGRISL